ncbi:MAG: DUF885 domain-containing protein [Opitutia bacterium Tous-C1TDCM]|nr:MAG: DUF885 domain-containing protein [Opitutae bacterium Tous-C1TDCM]
MRCFRIMAVCAAVSLCATPAAATYSPAEIAAESKKANDFFERAYQDRVDRSPELQSYLGIKKDQGRWDDESETRVIEDFAREAALFAELKRTVNFAALDPRTQLSYRLWVGEAERAIEGFRWRHHDYPVNQMFGRHTALVSLLISQHRIDDVKDAEAYVERLRGLKARLATVVENLEIRRAKGIVPPKFVFPIVLESSRGIVQGAPFDGSGKPSALLEDFEGKLAKLAGAEAPVKARLLAAAKDALLTSVKPGYDALIAKLEALEREATEDDGVWKFPAGAEFYDYQLRGATTTGLGAAEIHELGLKEVARIHAEMDAIRAKVGFAGDRAAFFKHLREDPKFYLPNTAEGRAAYLEMSIKLIDTMRSRLDELFITKPRVRMVVKPVEPFRERESASAFYQPPSADGSRPGMYYVNLYDTSALPIYEMEALAYHEGLPGHHMQIAIAQELEGIPRFRRFGFSNTAYVEGWGLYCELVPKEMGFYTDPYSDFGRLSMELWRAARLVVDTGLHAKRWTRAQTIAWLKANTPNTDREIVTETNRYIVLPGQATAYKVGMLKILELRALAQRELGPRFDVRRFHDLVLRDGAVPLDVLEEIVRGWIARGGAGR